MSRKFSITIVVCVAALVCIGLVMIYSASSYVAELQLHDSLYYVKKQLGGVIVGIALFVGAMFFDIQLLKKFNDLIAADDRVEKVILPLRDGLTIIRKK